MLEQDKYTEGLQCSLAHPTAYGPQTGIHLARRRAENEGNDCVASNFDVLEGPENVNFPERHD